MALKPLPADLAEAPWLRRPETQAVFAALQADGAVARCVGGAVRNWLLGTAVADIDIATTATPEEAMALAERAGLKVHATGLQHGTVTIVAGDIAHEVTTLRRDIATDGRHATVAFTTDWHADASRRDFTMNALYCDADGTIFDPLGGLADIKARRVRFIGEPADRIKEDYLRILRFFRFNAQYGLAQKSDLVADASTPGVDAAGLSAAIQLRDGLTRLSAERIQAELLKTLAAPAGPGVITVMFNSGFLPLLLGVVPRLTNLQRLAAIDTTLRARPDPALGLAALTIGKREDVGKIQQRLRLSSADTEALAQAVFETDSFAHQNGVFATAAPQERDAKQLLYRLGPDNYYRRILLAWARSGAATSDTTWASALSLPKRWPIPSMPFGGKDVVALGIGPGPAVGEVLRRFETWWIKAGFPTDNAANAKQLTQFVGAIRGADKAR